MRMRGWLALVATVLLLAVVSAGCSDEGDDTADPAPLTGRSSAGMTPSPGSRPVAAQARADEALLRAEDLDPSWTSGDQGVGGPNSAQGIGACITQIDPAQNLARAASPPFAKQVSPAAAAFTTSFSAVFPGDGAPRLMAELAGGAFPRCLEDRLSGGGYQLTDVVAVPGFPAVGDQSLAYSGALAVTLEDGQLLGGELAVAAVRTGDLVTLISFTDLGDVVDPRFLADLAEAVASRQRGDR